MPGHIDMTNRRFVDINTYAIPVGAPGITLAMPSQDANGAKLSVQVVVIRGGGGNIIWRQDGKDPTLEGGILHDFDKEQYLILSGNLADLRITADGAAFGTVAYFV